MLVRLLTAPVVCSLVFAAGCGGGVASGGLPAPAAIADGALRTQLAGPDVHQLGGCDVFPANNPWNEDISSAPVDPNSANYMTAMNAGSTFLHPDFGHSPHYGIPVTIAAQSTPFVPMKFFLYKDQSNPGPYPFPPNAQIEGGPH